MVYTRSNYGLHLNSISRSNKQLQGENMRKHILWLLMIIATLISFNAFSQSRAIRIQFQRGAISSEWHGTIYRGAQDFILRLGAYQNFTVHSPDVYSWSVISPRGQELSCDGGDCTLSLPMSGDYIIKTYYRMDSCYNCPVAASRKVAIAFIAN